LKELTVTISWCNCRPHTEVKIDLQTLVFYVLINALRE